MSILYKIRNYDKYLHLAIGTFIVFVVTYLTNPVLGTLAAVLIARWKELYDKARPANHTIDGWDAYATVAGAPIGLAGAQALQQYVGPYQVLVQLIQSTI